MAINFIPKDVLLEILARLPVKSLLRFRLVAKSWREILKEPTFIAKHHLTQVSLNHGNCVITRAYMPLKYREDFALLTEDEQGIKCTYLELPFFKDLDKSHLEVAGPCNGIVIISNTYDDLFLWNPATREYKALPSTAQPSSLLPDALHRGNSRVGFGIDPITNDYKVVRIWDFCQSRDVFIYKAEVFSLSATSCRPKSESWKIIDAVFPISQALVESDQAYLNGKYYWCTVPPERQEGRPCRLLWFDMGAEVFGLIELPNLCSDFYWNKLGVFKESLAMVMHAYNVENTYMYEIWIMDGSDGFSWKKYASVGPFKELETPIGFWKNEELLVQNGRDEEHDYGYVLYSYDVKTNVMKKIMEDVFLDLDLPLPIYNESLVSVVGED